MGVSLILLCWMSLVQIITRFVTAHKTYQKHLIDLCCHLIWYLSYLSQTVMTFPFFCMRLPYFFGLFSPQNFALFFKCRKILWLKNVNTSFFSYRQTYSTSLPIPAQIPICVSQKSFFFFLTLIFLPISWKTELMHYPFWMGPVRWISCAVLRNELWGKCI